MTQTQSLQPQWNEPPWSQQPWENEAQHRAFDVFRSLPSQERDMAEVATLCKMGRDHVLKLSQTYHWRYRIEAYEQFVSKGKRTLLQRRNDDMHADHLYMLAIGRDIVLREWKNLRHRQRELDAQGPGCTVLSPGEANAMAQMIVKLERLVKGEVTERAGEEFDLSSFTNAELLEWKRLTAKATTRPEVTV